MPAFLAAIIGALAAALMNALRTYLPGLIGRVLIAFGLTVAVTQVGLPALQAFLQSYFSGLPSAMFAYAGALGLDKAATMIISSAIAVRAQRVALSRISAS